MTNTQSVIIALLGVVLAAVIVAEVPAGMAIGLAAVAAASWCWWLDAQ
jgi:hypothetical protein